MRATTDLVHLQSSGGWNHHVEHNSSQDPTIASTQAVKPISNARTHPRASLKDSKTLSNSQESSKKAWDGAFVLGEGRWERCSA